jgi:hypothetical protein
MKSGLHFDFTKAANAPNQQEIVALVHTISHRVAGFLEREGILERDEENSYLNREKADEDPQQQVLVCSVSYCIAIGSQQGRNRQGSVAYTLRGRVNPRVSGERSRVGKAGNVRRIGFRDQSVHCPFTPFSHAILNGSECE